VNGKTSTNQQIKLCDCSLLFNLRLYLQWLIVCLFVFCCVQKLQRRRQGAESFLYTNIFWQSSEDHPLWTFIDIIHVRYIQNRFYGHLCEAYCISCSKYTNSLHASQFAFVFFSRKNIPTICRLFTSWMSNTATDVTSRLSIIECYLSVC